MFITLVPKVCNNVFLLVGLTTLGIFVNFDWLIHYVKCSNVLTTNFNYRRSNFVYHYLECTSIYQLLSYPFKSLVPTSHVLLPREEVQSRV